MAGLTPAHLLIILIIALIVIGPGKLPEVGAALGKSLREFQKASGAAQDPVVGPETGVATPMPLAQALPGQPPTRPSDIPQPGDGVLMYPTKPIYLGPFCISPLMMPYQPPGGVMESAPGAASPIFCHESRHQHAAPAVDQPQSSAGTDEVSSEQG